MAMAAGRAAARVVKEGGAELEVEGREVAGTVAVAREVANTVAGARAAVTVVAGRAAVSTDFSVVRVA